MDRPILHAFVRELLEHDRLQAFADALPDARARVSEPALPLVVAALHELLDRGLVVLCAEDADARDVAEAAGWFIGDERVGLPPTRAEERGHVAVRGGLVDVFPTTGREPLRIEFFGDEIESIRAYSPFTQRALHPVERAVVYPAAERRRDLSEATLPDEEGPPPVPKDLVPPIARHPDLVWAPEAGRRAW